ncbi:MAG: gliding motility-associated C-terminal domain-containing protein, partial [Bacteroidota bacterium]
ICEDGEPAALLTVINGDQYDEPAFQWQQSFDEGMTWQTLAGENDDTFLHTNLSSGFYYYRYLLANGAVNLDNNKCRVVSNTKIVYVVPKRYEIIDTLCVGLSFTVGNNAYDQSGTSVDTLVSSLGCDSIVTLQLTILPDPGLVPNFAAIDPSCAEFEDGSLQLTSVTGAVDPLELILFDTIQNPANVFPGLPEGDYAYQVTDRYGCSTEGTLTLRSPNPFGVSLGSDLTVELGETARINVSAFDTVATYRWLPAGLTDCTTDCTTLELFPQNSFQLSLDAISDAGCPASDSIRITVVKNRRVYFATAFSPNADGVNDNFSLQGAIPNVTIIENLEVFDRWGNQVFAGSDLVPNDLSQGWNGEDLKGERAPAGTYVYTGRVRFLDGEVRNYKGSLVLVR